MPKMSLDELTPYHRNPRRGRIELITESLQNLGQYRPIVVNTGSLTGRAMEVLAGNHTLAAASELGWSEIDVHLIDVDEHTARRIVLVDNRSNDVAQYDDDELLAILDALPTLEATGWTDDERAALRASLSPVFEPDDEEAARLDMLEPKICQRCGYDVANNPEGLARDADAASDRAVHA